MKHFIFGFTVTAAILAILGLDIFDYYGMRLFFTAWPIPLYSAWLLLSASGGALAVYVKRCLALPEWLRPKKA